MINKDFKWYCHCIAVIEIHTSDNEYNEFLNELNSAKTMLDAKAIIHRWFMGVV